MKLEAATRLTATDWWDALDADQKKAYISEHPNSEHAKEGVGAEEPKDDPKPLSDGLKAPGPLKEPPALEEGPGEEEPKEKPAPKKKPKSKDDSLTHFLYEKGKGALKDVGHKALEKSKKGILHRLIDPMGLTHPKEVGPSKSKEPKPSSSKKPAPLRPSVKTPSKIARVGKPAPSKSSSAKKLESPEYKKAGGKGISEFGYWKDKDTWVSETKQEWESKLTPEERKHYGR